MDGGKWSGGGKAQRPRQLFASAVSLASCLLPTSSTEVSLELGFRVTATQRRGLGGLCGGSCCWWRLKGAGCGGLEGRHAPEVGFSVMGKRPSRTAAGENDEEPEPTVALEDVEDRIDVLRKGRPPPPYTLEDFRDKFGYSAEGMNPHIKKESVVIKQSELKAVYGAQKGKSGFFFGDCKNVDVKSAINRIYPVVYQHPHGPKNKLIGNDFAIGIVADVVKKLDVSWAAFALQTNCNQRSAWKKKMVTTLQTKASLIDQTFEEVAAEEGLDDLLQVIFNHSTL